MADTISRRVVLKAGAAGLAATAAGLGQADGQDGRAYDEFIRVAPDRWSFETARSRRKFVPFGSNLVLTNKEDLNIFGPRYSDERYKRILEACAGQGINILKVFLPIGSLLPDPQPVGGVAIAPGYLENMERFLALCKPMGIRAVICNSEWGVHACKWWPEGGQYYGRRPWKTDPGPDSIGTLERFWRVLAHRLKDNPTVFSYTPCAEWSMPNGNMTPPWAPPEPEIGLLQGPVALWYWRRWLEAKYGSCAALSRAWGIAVDRFDAVPIVDYRYDEANHRYLDPVRKILDYQSFREWATHRYFRPQVKAIRSADTNHMVTISNHMRSWNLWEGAAKHFLGYTPSEETAYIDYMTLHANYAEGETSQNRPPEKVVHEVEVLARFSHAGKPMPIILEEFTYATPDPARTARAEETLVRGTVGHVSGWMTWYLQFPTGATGATSADADFPFAWLDADLRPTPWGEAALRLSRELATTDLRRKPPRRTIRLDRDVELAPLKTGTITGLFLDYKPDEHPVDYIIPHEKDLDIRL